MAGVASSADGRRGVRYAGGMRYPDGGGLSVQEGARREWVRLVAGASGQRYVMRLTDHDASGSQKECYWKFGG